MLRAPHLEIDHVIVLVYVAKRRCPIGRQPKDGTVVTATHLAHCAPAHLQQAAMGASSGKRVAVAVTNYAFYTTHRAVQVT